VIVVDTSALMAVVLKEAGAESLANALETNPLLLSANIVAEALIVARRRGVGPEMAKLLGGLDAEIVPVTANFADKVADAYDRWGKGAHPAGLNIIDCFAYTLAKERDCPLLYVGEDFAKTDVQSALG
jgi:ribonuclease VapC